MRNCVPRISPQEFCGSILFVHPRLADPFFDLKQFLLQGFFGPTQILTHSKLHGTNKDWYKHYAAVKRKNDESAMQTFLQQHAADFKDNGDSAKGPTELR